MGDEDIEILAFAEKNSDDLQWDLSIRFEGNCKIGCEGRKMLRTKNLVTALNWAEWHREGFEHIEAVLTKYPVAVQVRPNDG